MVFNCAQDICSSFSITFVWSVQLVPGGCGEGERKRKKIWGEAVAFEEGQLQNPR